MDKFENTENSENSSKLQLRKEFTQFYLFAFQATVLTLLATDSEHKINVWKISEVSEFQYLP